MENVSSRAGAAMSGAMFVASSEAGFQPVVTNGHEAFVQCGCSNKMTSETASLDEVIAENRPPPSFASPP